MVVTCGADKTVRVLDPRKSFALVHTLTLPDFPYSMGVAGESAQLLCGCGDRGAQNGRRREPAHACLPRPAQAAWRWWVVATAGSTWWTSRRAGRCTRWARTRAAPCAASRPARTGSSAAATTATPCSGRSRRRRRTRAADGTVTLHYTSVEAAAFERGRSVQCRSWHGVRCNPAACVRRSPGPCCAPPRVTARRAAPAPARGAHQHADAAASCDTSSARATLTHSRTKVITRCSTLPPSMA